MRKFLASLLLGALVFAVYAPSLRNAFVWDDTALVLRDPLIRSWRLVPESFQHFLFLDATASDFYRPVQRLTYTLDYALFHFRAAGYHGTSIAWHVAAAVAFYFFVLEFCRVFDGAERRRRWLPLAAATAWALHPLQSSAVAYISGRADPLAAAFGFLGLFLALRSLRAAGRGRWSFTLAAGASFFLSSLSKESGLVFLAFVLALFLFGKNGPALRRFGVIALFVLVGYLSLRLPAEHFPAPRLKEPAPLLARPILMARALAEYAGVLVWPQDLRMERDVETQSRGMDRGGMTTAARMELQTLAGLVLFAGLIYWAGRERKRNRAVLASLLLALIAYLPVSGIFPLNATVAEHWLYLPSAFFLLAAAFPVARFIGSASPWPRLAASTVVAVWLLFCAGRTFTRTLDWKDQRTFLERTIAAGGESPRMLINLGGLELKEGRLDRARKNLQAALALAPNHPLATINLAAVAVKENDFVAARDLLQRARSMPLVEAQAHELTAVLENKETGKINVTRLRLASRTSIPNWTIEQRYIRALAETGALAAAIAELRSCLTTQWYRAESWELLGLLESQAGREEEAKKAFARARELDVHLPPRPDLVNRSL